MRPRVYGAGAGAGLFCAQAYFCELRFADYRQHSSGAVFARQANGIEMRPFFVYSAAKIWRSLTSRTSCGVVARTRHHCDRRTW